MAANMHFLRKLASDELKDTLFFATGQRAERLKSDKALTLTAGKFEVVITTNRNIVVNGDKCKSVPEAKWVLQSLL